MVGHMSATPILSDLRGCPVEGAVRALSGARRKAPFRCDGSGFPRPFWFSLQLLETQDPGFFTSWIGETALGCGVDFDDAQYGGYGAGDFDLLVRDYDFSRLVERPGLLKRPSRLALGPWQAR